MRSARRARQLFSSARESYRCRPGSRRMQMTAADTPARSVNYAAGKKTRE